MVYNRMTEICFQKCSSNFNYRNLTMDEERCVDNCAGKLIRSNHRLMGTYVHLMPRMVQRRMDEMEAKSKALEAEATAAGAVEGAVEIAPTLPSETALTPTSETPALRTLVGADVTSIQPPTTLGVAMDYPVASNPGGNLETPDIPAMASLAELDFPTDLVPSASVSIAAPPPTADNKMAAITSAAAAAAAETAFPSSLTEAVRGAGLTALPPLESPSFTPEPPAPAAAGASLITLPKESGNAAFVTSVPLVAPEIPDSPVVLPVSAPAVKPIPGLAEPAKPLVEALPKTTISPALISNNDVSFSPSVAPSFVTKQDVPPPS